MMAQEDLVQRSRATYGRARISARPRRATSANTRNGPGCRPIRARVSVR